MPPADSHETSPDDGGSPIPADLQRELDSPVPEYRPQYLARRSRPFHGPNLGNRSREVPIFFIPLT
jgi:hypothetical protein